ncbi:Hsp70 family protein [Candidatus Uabimicrobium sp. HlEnr_7]|uniref:hsp70 family protein n=1 Tax=Candidatus Uabimicrobium helgolandensis TaxID=3095367 RepID=UPI003555C3BB
MQETPYLVGIDLGTTNCSVAYIDRKRKRSQHKVKIFEIPQVVSTNTIEARKTLPSFHYNLSEHDALPITMPWEDKPNFVVGEFAKKQKIPNNIVHSAKSWLCHSHVDRRSAILPWGSKNPQKISPVEASARYLIFIKKAWNEYTAKNPNEYLEKQQIILTVPAAFDQDARELTLEAATQAGFMNVSLLEEPMAAFYSWIYFYQLKWPKKVEDNMLALVCDIGGGTTDFSLIELKRQNDNVNFKRIAVGKHLLLGGDNMDLALAHSLEKSKLSNNQFLELVSSARHAKEHLWTSGNEEKSLNINIMGGGSSLIKGSKKFHIDHSLLNKVIVEQFFPFLKWESPSSSVQPGLKQWGLPYETDPRVTKHLRDFLQTHLPQGTKPDLVLFNGGVLTPKAIRDHISKQLQQWFSTDSSTWKPIVLTNNKLDLAVAIGASYFHLVQRGEGIQIGGGIPRSYYLEIKKHKGQKKGLCILPFASRQQQFFEINQHALEVIAKQPVSFKIYSSNERKNDELGEIVNIEDDMLPLPSVQTVIKVGKTAKNHQIPVTLQVQMNEIGLLEIRLVAKDSERIWRLQFQMTETQKQKNPKQVSSKKKIVFPEQKVKEIIHGVFYEDHPPRTLKNDIEKILGCKKDAWDLQLNRKVWDILILFAAQKNRSENHEERWLHLIGFCLRPGIGFPGDDWRVKKLFPILENRVHFPRNIQSWMEYWILCRRIAASLRGDQQLNILRSFGEHLLGESTKWKMKKNNRKHVKAAEKIEMWRTASSFENLSVKVKQQLGDEVIRLLSKEQNTEYLYWALGRLGARILFYNQNPLDKEQITPWIETLLAIKNDDFHRLSSLAQLARKSGDRAIDINDTLRQRVIEELQNHDDSVKVAELCLSVETITVLNEKLQKHYFGDSLPTGLVLK